VIAARFDGLSGALFAKQRLSLRHDGRLPERISGVTQALDMTAAYVSCPDAMQSRLGAETAILHLGSGTYFGLDALGTVVWDTMGAGQAATPVDLYADARTSFSDAPDTVGADLTAFPAQLVTHDLIRRP
jgi:hypothetical protein